MCARVEGAPFEGMQHMLSDAHACHARTYACRAHAYTIIHNSGARFKERRACADVQIPDGEGIDHLGQIQRHHDQRLQEDWHEASVRPPKLLQDR